MTNSKLLKISFSKILEFVSQIIFVFILYSGTLFLIDKVTVAGIYTFPIWIPSGIIFSAVIIIGYRLLPSIYIGVFLSFTFFLQFSSSEIISNNTILTSLLFALAEVIEIFITVLLFKKIILRNDFISNSSLLTKFFILAIFSSSFGAILGTSIFTFFNISQFSNYPIAWLNWALGHLLAYMIFTPVILNWQSKSFLKWSLKQKIEVALLFVTMIILSQIIFGDLFPAAIVFSFPYLVIPILLWVVIKFGFREITLILMVLSIISIYNTINGNGPFFRESFEYSILSLQEYLVAVSVSVLLLHSAISKLRKTEKELRSYKTDLEIKVEERAKEINQKNQRLEKEIDERIKTEKRLRELSEAVEQSPASVIITDKAGTIVYANPKFLQLKGYAKEEVIGQNPRFFKSEVHNNKFYKQLWSTVTSGNIWQGEILNKKKNGELFWEMALISPILNENGEIFRFVGIYEDISKQKEAEDEIQKYLEKLSESEFELQQLNLNKDKFFSILAHDLKGPFSSLLGFSEFLVHDFEELTLNEIKKYSVNIHESTKNTFKLLENLLEWGRVQRNMIDLNFSNINLFEIANKTIELYSAEANKKKVKLELKLKNDCIVHADQNTIATVFRNLTSNAIKFCQSGDVITISSSKIDNDIQVTISDTGVGISEDDLAKLFRIDVHHTSTGTAHEKGTGLGLILCKDLLEKNNSEITVESSLGKGTTFSFILPGAAL